MSDCCRKLFLFLSYLVASVGSIAYCFYLIWLVAYVKSNGYYWFFAFLPGFSVLVSCLIWVLCKQPVSSHIDFLPPNQDPRNLFLIFLAVANLILMVMCTFTMLTRQAYYHLSTDDLIGPQWVIMSLKGSIVFFISGFLVKKECRFQNIRKDKDILSRVLLDFVDIFNLVELLSLNKCVGIGSSVTEGSSLEMAIQAFCTLSFLIIQSVSVLHVQRFHSIYVYSPMFQNIPFLIIRIVVWARHGVFSLDFMVKNIWAIVVCCTEMCSAFSTEDEGKPTNEGIDNDIGSGSGNGNGNATATATATAN